MIAIHAAWSPGEIRVAAAKDGVLTDYAVWRPGSPDGMGDLHRGRILAQVPAMAGAFVALDGVEGFLPESEGAKGLNAGALVTVRITRAAAGGKGPRLSARGVPEAEGPTGLIQHGRDPLRELAARYPSAGIVVDDAGFAASLRADLGSRLTRVARAFDDDLETAVEVLAAAEVTLSSGARMTIHPTPALVAIDIDGGAALVRGGGQAGAEPRRDGQERGTGGNANRWHRAFNMSIIPDLARQIRLRNLSGAILVDFAGMKAKQRATLAPALAAALAEDPMRPRFLGFTALGLGEIARPRGRAPLHEVLAGPLASGLVALRRIAHAVQAEPGRRLALAAAPGVVAALREDKMALPDLARVTGAGLELRSDPSLPADSWRIEAVHG